MPIKNAFLLHFDDEFNRNNKFRTNKDTHLCGCKIQHILVAIGSTSRDMTAVFQYSRQQYSRSVRPFDKIYRDKWQPQKKETP